MRKIHKTLAIMGLLNIGWVSPAQAITFNTFINSGDLAGLLSNYSTIGFSYAGDKFVGSVYYGSNNNQLYSSDLSGGNLQKFGTPIPGFSGEVYVSSSLGVGGYGPRDVFAGSEALGTVYRISHDGSSQSAFVSGLAGGVRSIAFDPYGNYGDGMIVATNSGNIYKVSNLGAPTLLASVGEDAEGLSFAPQAFGTYAKGTLFVASESSGYLRAIGTDGSVSVAVTGLSGAEMVNFVPLNLGSSGNPVEGFYAAAYPYNIQKAAASEFMPYLGDAIITDEYGHRIYDVKWNGSQFVTSILGYFPAQPEDGIFVTADVIRPPVPEPDTYGLMLTGLGLMGLMARRRKTSA